MTGWIGKMRLLKILSNKFQKLTIHSYMIVSISLVTKASHATITTQILRKKNILAKQLGVRIHTLTKQNALLVRIEVKIVIIIRHSAATILSGNHLIVIQKPLKVIIF